MKIIRKSFKIDISYHFMKKAIFLDRDGVINKKAIEGEYISSFNEFEFLPGVLESLKKVPKRDYLLIIVTNQRGIARKKISINDLELIHNKMLNEMDNYCIKIDKIYFCPHNYGECNCRKPNVGMIEMAEKDFKIDMENSWIIGDSLSDIELGIKKGLQTIYLGNTLETKMISNYSFDNLSNAIDLILSLSKKY